MECRGQRDATFDEETGRRTPPCEITGRCFVTELAPDDPEYPMVIDPIGQFILSSWNEITSISRKESIEWEKNKKRYSMQTKTLEHLSLWMNNQDWNTVPVDRKEFFRLLTILHVAYLNNINKIKG